MSKRPAKEEKLAEVVNLHDLRLHRRLDTYRARLDRVIKANKRAVTRMFSSGFLFTKDGTRSGRDLLTAHEHLLRAMMLLNRLGNQGDVPAPRKAEEVDAVFAELDKLLSSTAELTEQTGALLNELRKE